MLKPIQITYIIVAYKDTFNTPRLEVKDIKDNELTLNIADFDAWFIGDLEVTEDVMNAWLGTSANLTGNVYVGVTEDNELVVNVVYSAEIANITAVADVAVDYGTTEDNAKAALAQTTTIADEYGKVWTVGLTWTIDSYVADTAGEYDATGTFTLPQGVVQTSPATELKVTAKVTVNPQA